MSPPSSPRLATGLPGAGQSNANADHLEGEMPAASTMAPAPSRTPAPSPSPAPRRLHPEPAERAPVTPQHMRALARANEVRLARAALKRTVAAGRRSAAEIVLDCPWEVESMPLGELLSAQRRWGLTRSRKFITALSISENKKIGTLTNRQRKLVAGALAQKNCQPLASTA